MCTSRLSARECRFRFRQVVDQRKEPLFVCMSLLFPRRLPASGIRPIISR